MSLSAQATLRATLGYAGLIPFAAGAFAMVFLPPWAHWASLGFVSYSATIVAFMAGSLWASVASRLAMLTAIIVSLSACAALLLAVAGLTLSAIALLGALLALLWAVERYSTANSAGYMALRTRLTVLATLAHLVALASLNRAFL